MDQPYVWFCIALTLAISALVRSRSLIKVSISSSSSAFRYSSFSKYWWNGTWYGLFPWCAVCDFNRGSGPGTGFTGPSGFADGEYLFVNVVWSGFVLLGTGAGVGGAFLRPGNGFASKGLPVSDRLNSFFFFGCFCIWCGLDRSALPFLLGSEKEFDEWCCFLLWSIYKLKSPVHELCHQSFGW